MSTTAAVFAVPRKEHSVLLSDEARDSMRFDLFPFEVAQWVDRVNQRAGRDIVIDGTKKTQPTTYRVVDRLEINS